MRTIILSFILCGVLLVGWDQLVKRKLSGTRTVKAAAQFDQNVMKAQSFIYARWQPKVVIAGSSISARLTSHPKEWYNLAFAGGSAFTALDIIDKSESKPDVVLIETNVLTVAEDHRLLDSLFFPILSKARDRYPGLREQYKPSHVLVTALPSPESSNKSSGLSADRFGEQVDRRLKELATEPKDEALEAIVEKLQAYVKKLQNKGIRVAFFEVPEYDKSTNLPKPTAVRKAVQRAFPESQYAWVPFVDAEDYTTTDAVHLDSSSAKRYANVVADYVAALSASPATRPRANPRGSTSRAIDHEGRRVVKELPQHSRRLFRQLYFLQRSVHQLHPPIAPTLIDVKRPVPHAQARMAALLRVGLRAAETLDEKFLKPLLRAGHIVGWIHGAEDVVGDNATIKRADESGKSILTDRGVDVGVEKIHRSQS